MTNNRRGQRRSGHAGVWPHTHATATPLPPIVRPTWRPDLPTTTVTVVEPTATYLPSVTVQGPTDQMPPHHGMYKRVPVRVAKTPAPGVLISQNWWFSGVLLGFGFFVLNQFL